MRTFGSKLDIAESTLSNCRKGVSYRDCASIQRANELPSKPILEVQEGQSDIRFQIYKRQLINDQLFQPQKQVHPAQLYSLRLSFIFIGFVFPKGVIQFMKAPKRSVQILTGQFEPITFKDMQKRVSFIRNRNKLQAGSAKNLIDREQQQLNKTQELIPRRQAPHDVETDQLSTNFYPKFQDIQESRPTIKSFSRSGRPPQRRSTIIVADSEKKRPLTSYKRSVKVTKTILVQEGKLTGEAQANIYRQQIGEFKNLYEHLAGILSCISRDTLEEVEQAIKKYVDFVQSKKLSFIDDFIEGRQKKLQKVVRDGRLHQSLSVAYLFLEMAQSRIENHESYLTNFLGFCLSNVLLTARLYSLKEGRSDFIPTDFEQAMREVERGSFGSTLTSVDDVLLRLQHNNEIITLMHKKLGRFNPKFQSCIQLFFKTADRKKISCTQCTYYIFQYLSMHIHESQMTGISKTLQIAPIPYCPPAIKNYTLVIEPLGILTQNNRTRPYLFQFFEWAHKYFDIVLWTWEMPYEPEIENIYKKLQEFISGKLYRYHCIEQNQIWVKDLSRIGRATQKMLVIDYDKRIFNRQPKNGVQLRWRYSGTKDKGLLLLCQILQQMISSESIVEDMTTIYAQELYSIRGY